MKPESYSLFCPRCEADGQSTKAYCKRCGEWLTNSKARGRGFGGETPQQNILTARSTAALNAADMADFVSTPSVTESTTELLEPVQTYQTERR